MRNYSTATLEEYFATPQDESDFVITLPESAVKELQTLKSAKNRSELVLKTLKKHLINARQAQTNAKIVESLIG